uniref:Uncharacterized protein n=1 Tax=Romanomermis culicivorax TaxID=13658 RepID=A0A915IC08_ROMCU
MKNWQIEKDFAIDIRRKIERYDQFKAEYTALIRTLPEEKDAEPLFKDFLHREKIFIKDKDEFQVIALNIYLSYKKILACKPFLTFQALKMPKFSALSADSMNIIFPASILDPNASDFSSNGVLVSLQQILQAVND